MSPPRNMHREDVKAELRKRFGSVAAFERKAKIPEKSVNDVLRGRRSARVEKAINKALSTPFLPPSQSEGSDHSGSEPAAHRLIAEAR